MTAHLMHGLLSALRRAWHQGCDALHPAPRPTLLADAEGSPWLGLNDPSRHGFCASYQEEWWTEGLGVLATEPN
jgi:hypothetical protein